MDQRPPQPRRPLGLEGRICPLHTHTSLIDEQSGRDPNLREFGVLHARVGCCSFKLGSAGLQNNNGAAWRPYYVMVVITESEPYPMFSNSQGWDSEACRPVAFRYDPAGHETDNDEGTQTDDDVAPAVGSKQ